MTDTVVRYNPADQHLYTRDQIMDRMCMTLGGRASEELNFGIITTGASDDLDKVRLSACQARALAHVRFVASFVFGLWRQVTKMAYGTVVSYGMGTSCGPLSYRAPQQGDMTIGKPYSEGECDRLIRVFCVPLYRVALIADTASLIDDEVMIMVRQAYTRTKDLLQTKLKEVGLLAELLIEREVVQREDVERLLGKRPFDTETHFRVMPTPPTPTDGVPVAPSVSAVRAIQ